LDLRIKLQFCRLEVSVVAVMEPQLFNLERQCLLGMEISSVLISAFPQALVSLLLGM